MKYKIEEAKSKLEEVSLILNSLEIDDFDKKVIRVNLVDKLYACFIRIEEENECKQV